MFASTAVINFTGYNPDEDLAYTLNKVIIEDLTQGWTDTVTEASLTIEINNAEGIDNVLEYNDFVVTTNGYTTQALFYMEESGIVSVLVYDAAGHCVCQSTTEKGIGFHKLDLEFAIPQIYYLHITTPCKSFTRPILNVFAHGNNIIQYIEQSSIKRMFAHNLNTHDCKVGDSMRYTGHVILDGEEYTDVKQEIIHEGVNDILFLFNIEAKADYYIKHPWGSGNDEDWTWQPMKKESTNRYTYTGYWGGIGVNINTKKIDGSATYIDVSSIPASKGIHIGDEVVFVYDASKGKITLEDPSGVRYILASEATQLAQVGDTGTYNIFGYVTYIRETYNTTYSNQSFKINDNPVLYMGAYGFTAWRVKNSTITETIEVGSKVMIHHAKLINYNNTTPETVAGAQFSLVEPFDGYYIKHPWGTGLDEDWQYDRLTRIGTTTEYWTVGEWGGIGANISTFELMFEEDGPAWIPESQMDMTGNISIGDRVKFTYNANNKTLQVIKLDY